MLAPSEQNSFFFLKNDIGTASARHHVSAFTY